jgi:drug/metabolite transporter (DMT)-like permease
MVFGGGALTLVGLVTGEVAQLTPASFTAVSIASFVHLLVFGSLVGFVAFTWLLNNTSAALAGTYSYVNPIVAVLLGWWLAGERITPWALAGMAVILGSVALVRGPGTATVYPAPPRPEQPRPRHDECRSSA